MKPVGPLLAFVLGAIFTSFHESLLGKSIDYDVVVLEKISNVRTFLGPIRKGTPLLYCLHNFRPRIWCS